MELKLAHLSALVESSDDAIVSTTFDGVINSWNNSATRLFGYTADEVIGRKGGFLVPADQVDEEPPLLKIIQNGEHIDHYQTVRQRKDGSLINVSITISPIRNVAGDIIGASGIARDISNQKWAQEAEQRRTVAQAKLDLISVREREVLTLVVAGEPNKVIARKLDRSEKTIEKYRAGLMKTAGSSQPGRTSVRTSALCRTVSRGYLRQPPSAQVCIGFPRICGRLARFRNPIRHRQT